MNKYNAKNAEKLHMYKLALNSVLLVYAMTAGDATKIKVLMTMKASGDHFLIKRSGSYYYFEGLQDQKRDLVDSLHV